MTAPRLILIVEDKDEQSALLGRILSPDGGTNVWLLEQLLNFTIHFGHVVNPARESLQAEEAVVRSDIAAVTWPVG